MRGPRAHRPHPAARRRVDRRRVDRRRVDRRRVDRRRVDGRRVDRRRVGTATTALVLAAGLLAGPLGLPGRAAPGDGTAAGPGGSAVAAAGSGWSVRPAGVGAWTVRWRSPARLPLTADRPVVLLDGRPLEGRDVQVSADGRTVVAQVRATVAPVAGGLDVVLSGRVLDEPGRPRLGSPPPGGPAGRLTPPVQDLLPVDPGAPGPLRTVTDDYSLAGIDLGFDEPVEMVGHVVKPQVADPGHPLVLFLHGRHSYCFNPATGRLTFRWPCDGRSEPIPSQRGYDYVQTLLASHGYLTVSVAANGINAQDFAAPDGGARARSALVRAHLEHWSDLVAAGTEQADLGRVVLVGHSRGGEGVARASLEIGLDAGYRVAGQVLLAPTDFSRQTSPYVPTVTVLPSCDGDVSDLQGQQYTDLSRGLVPADTSLRSSVLVVGANHNFFNTEWTPGLAAAPADDDWGSTGGACGSGGPDRLSGAEQRQVGRAYVAGAVRLLAGGEQSFAPMYDGSPVRVGSVGEAVVMSHALGGGRVMRTPGARLGLPGDPATGDAVVQLCRGLTPYSSVGSRLCGRTVASPNDTPHWPARGSLLAPTSAWEMSWRTAGSTGSFVLDDPLTVPADGSLDLRTVVDPARPDAVLRAVVHGTEGSTEVVPAAQGRLPALPRGPVWYPGKLWAQTLRLDGADLSGVGAVSRVDLVAVSGPGRVWVLDAAAVPTSLPPVDAVRVPLVDLGRAVVAEGDDPSGTAEVPFTLSTPAVESLSLRVYVLDDGVAGPPRPRVVTVPPGATGGTIAVPLAGNAVDDRRRAVLLLGQSLRNGVVREPEGRLVVVDDDPRPRVTLRAVRSTVREGGSLRVEARLSAPVGYSWDFWADTIKLRSPLPALRRDDLPEAWARDRVYCPTPRAPLGACDLSLYRFVRPGTERVRLSIPVARDRVREGREAVTLRVRIGAPLRVARDLTVTVAPSR